MGISSSGGGMRAGGVGAAPGRHVRHLKVRFPSVQGEANPGSRRCFRALQMRPAGFPKAAKSGPTAAGPSRLRMVLVRSIVR